MKKPNNSSIATFIIMIILVMAFPKSTMSYISSTPRESESKKIREIHFKSYYIKNLDLIYSGCDFYSIDTFVLNTPEDVENDITTLFNYITKPAKNDWEKVRAIFLWIADNISYDMDSYLSGVNKNVTGENTFKSKKSVCAGYAALFEQLIVMTGLEVVQILGYGKGAGYVNGKTFENTNHAWNAVKINGQWRLFDNTWGAGHVRHGFFKGRFSEFWFDTPPELMIYSHLPKDPQWQLLDNPISKKKFEKIPDIDELFFVLGFTNEEMQTGLKDSSFSVPKIFYCGDSQLKIIKAPLQDLLFSDQTYHFVVESDDVYKIALWNNYASYQLKKEKDFYTLSIKPKSGTLSLSIKPWKGYKNYRKVIRMKF